MNTQFGQEENSKITLNLDEFDIDTYDFKPVTKGLGFHDPIEKSKRPTAKPIKTMRKATNRSSGNPVTVNHLQNTPTTVSDPSLMSGIDALYGNKPLEEKVPTVPKEEVRPKTQRKVKEAGFTEMTGAFVVDTLIIFLIDVVLFSAFYAFAFKSFSLDGLRGFVFHSLPFFGTLFGLIFVTYFSLLEPLGTLGKKLWSIKTVVAGTSSSITIKLAFTRSFITLLSIPLLFFPLVFDFQGKLSDSAVIKD